MRQKTMSVSNSMSYSPEEIMAKRMKESLDRSASIQPVKKVETTNTDFKIEDKYERASIAFMLAKKYRGHNDLLKKFSHSKYPLTEKQIDCVHVIVQQIKDKEKDIELELKENSIKEIKGDGTTSFYQAEEIAAINAKGSRSKTEMHLMQKRLQKIEEVIVDQKILIEQKDAEIQRLNDHILRITRKDIIGETVSMKDLFG